MFVWRVDRAIKIIVSLKTELPKDRFSCIVQLQWNLDNFDFQEKGKFVRIRISIYQGRYYNQIYGGK